MLIKKKKLTGVKSLYHTQPAELHETRKAIQLEIHKAKQEAKNIRAEAESVLQEAQAKLLEAEQEANELIQQTNAEANQIKQKVYKETLAAGTKEANSLKEEAKNLLQELFEVKREALIQAHKEILNIAMSIAEKILKYQAEIDSNVLKIQVIEAIKKATSEAERVQVFVNPLDLATLESYISEIEKLFPAGVEIIPLSHENIDPGSCLIETKSGQLDASFTTQLKALKNLISLIEVREPEINDELLQTTSIKSNIQKPHSETEEKEAIDKPLYILEDNLLDKELVQNEEEHNFIENLKEEISPEDIFDDDLFHANDIKAISSSTENLIQESETFTPEEEKLKSELLSDPPLFKDMGAFSETVEDQVLHLAEDSIETEDSTTLEEPYTSTIHKINLEDDEDEIEFFDDLETDETEAVNKEQGVNLHKVLRPKEPKTKQISKIANELQSEKEWKDLIHNEDEE